MEEAGISGPVSSAPVGRYEYRKWGGTCSVEVFLMQVDSALDDWPESFRDREWLAPATAASRVEEPELGELLLLAAERLEDSTGS